MFRRKRKVGRPSNASKRKEKLFKVFFVVGIFSVFGFMMYNIKDFVEDRLSASTMNSKIDISSANVRDIPDYTYDGTEIKPFPIVTYKNGIKLVKNKDYYLNYKNNINAGTAIIYIRGRGNYTGTKIVTFKIIPTSQSSSTNQNNSRQSIQVSKNTTDISKVNIAPVGDQVYTGRAITPTPEAWVGSTFLKLNTDYKFSYENNINVGTATMKVIGIGKYSGVRTLNFNIVKLDIKIEDSNFPLTGDRCSINSIKFNVVSNVKIKNILYNSDKKESWGNFLDKNITYSKDRKIASIELFNSHDYINLKVETNSGQAKIFGPYKTKIGNCPSALHFLNVGEADAIVVESKGKYGLIDAGYPEKNKERLINYLNNMQIKHLEFIVPTHSDIDHIGGIQNLKEYVDSKTTFIYKQDTEPNNHFKRSYKVMKEANAIMFDTNAKNPTLTPNTNLLKLKYKSASNSDDSTVQFEMGDYVFTIYNLKYRKFNITAKYQGTINTATNVENTNSFVILLKSKSTGKKALLMGDANELGGVEYYYANKIGKVDLLKLGHHGYATSNSKLLLDKTSPKIAILTNDEDVFNNVSKDGSKGSFALARLYLRDKGTKVYKTGDFTDAIYVDSKNVYNESGTELNTNYTQMSTNMDNGAYKWHEWIGKLTTNTIDDNNRIKNNWYYIRNQKIVKNEYIYYETDKSTGTKYYYYYNGIGKRVGSKCYWYKTSNGKWQFYDETGKISKEKTIKVDNKKYKLNNNGICTSGSGC